MMPLPQLFEKGIYKITSNLQIKTPSPKLDADIKLLVLHQPLNENDQLLLDNILKATKMDEKLIFRWVLSEEEDIAFSHHLAPLKPLNILIFGYHPNDLNLQIKPLVNIPFTIQHHNMLLAIPLDQLTDQTQKRAFWVALQKFVG